MKKKFGIITLVSFLIGCGVLNLILFLTIPEERLEEGVFWFAWSFTFPLNLAIAGIATYFVSKKSSDALIHMPITYRIVLTAFFTYLALGIVLMYFPIVAFTVPIILEITLTAAYTVVILYSLLGMSYMAGNQAVTKQKVLFIRLLQSDLESCFHLVTDAALLADLKKLSEKIRFSDPMSHPSLSAFEAELNAVVFSITSMARCGNFEGIPAEITKANGLLDVRNDRCRILK